ncbi:hypothetical protein [Mucilaginibacter glaciei]|uniref:Carboxypeptidase-like protein n=1 Tax=Mucilaginibacter glaciei TaxID=2772109 RepID=A0A926NPK6_9SPHI|nr:hypothetical protein [Mucilaginibacter glaciei]MBD1393571.1 hypothetical protein [Mucilaginibacter glaciei]
MKLWLSVFFWLITFSAFAQQKEVSGIVFDKESKVRIAKVNVYNVTKGSAVYNTFKGEFKIQASVGDMLIFSKPDHFSDTVKLKSFAPVAVYLRPQAIQLQQVTIRDTMLNPQRRYQQTKSDYNRIYGSISSSEFLTASPGVGAGIGIDALYNAFSRSGRNAAHLREVIDRDYKQNVIDYRFNKTYVASVTKLMEPQLTEFMLKYRPGYYQVTQFNEYEFIASIRTNLRRYLRNPHAFDLPVLPIMPLPSE